MAQITINEVSQNYTYNVGSNSFCTVALPITACWGPGYVDPDTLGKSKEAVLEDVVWQKFPATQAGLESFISTYRGPAANYRSAKDYSYQMAVTLLASGYDVLVCRLCPGTYSKCDITTTTPSKEGGTVKKLTCNAKYPGTFGDSLEVKMSKVINKNYWNLIVYVVDNSGVKTAVENLVFALDVDNSSDNIPHISEVESKFLTFVADETLSDSDDISANTIRLTGGSDRANTNDKGVSDIIGLAKSQASLRYATVSTAPADTQYMTAFDSLSDLTNKSVADNILYREWLFTSAIDVYDLLTDKLAYNPNRIISPGWDDQNVTEISGESVTSLDVISPLHAKLMDVAYNSRCATALLDVPKCLPRSAVYDREEDTGYALLLARRELPTSLDQNGTLYTTHSALFAPWGQYKYVGTSKQLTASPSFLSLLIQRAMLLNQSLQYEWAMPSNRKHNLSLGKLDYNVPKKILDEWQKLDGVGINVITSIPDLGTSLWGNSTLYEVPPATYQALANLSTRYLVNAVENVVYRAGISITFNYNNDEAFSKFYAAVTPILDTMKQVGAIDGYYVKMAADINGLDQVNANSVIGKVYLVINGVINDITVDLVALPPGTDLTQFQG